MPTIDLEPLRDAVARLGYLSAVVDGAGGPFVSGSRAVTRAMFEAAESDERFVVERFMDKDRRKFMWVTLAAARAPAVPAWAKFQGWE